MKIILTVRNYLIAVAAAAVFYISFQVGIVNPVVGLAIFFGSAVIGAWLNWRYWHFVL